MLSRPRSSAIFPAAHRLRRAAEFHRARHQGKKYHTAHFLVLILKRPQGPTRLGLTVSRKIGGAVQRNRVKRLVREFFRRHYAFLPVHSDLSIVAKRGADELDYAAITGELVFLLQTGEP